MSAPSDHPKAYTAPPPPPPPLPPKDDVLITGERAKLPPAVAALVDVGIPVPASVQFFEERVTASSIVSSLLWSAVLAGLAFFSILFGVVILFDHTNVTVSTSSNWWLLFFGITCAFAAWLMLGGARERLRLRNIQAAGQRIRVGIFLTEDSIVEAAPTTFTVIPKGAFRGVQDGSIRYLHRGQEKSTRLPTEFIGADRNSVEQAIRGIERRA